MARRLKYGKTDPRVFKHTNPDRLLALLPSCCKPASHGYNHLTFRRSHVLNRRIECARCGFRGRAGTTRMEAARNWIADLRKGCTNGVTYPAGNEQWWPKPDKTGGNT